jgi:hypothetical protein
MKPNLNIIDDYNDKRIAVSSFKFPGKPHKYD